MLDDFIASINIGISDVSASSNFVPFRFGDSDPKSVIVILSVLVTNGSVSSAACKISELKLKNCTKSKIND